jgi:hypothetical protein
MTRVLLLGAGFSRNWGGWLAAEVFDYLLACPQVNDALRSVLFAHKRRGGFEGALAHIQSNQGPQELLQPFQAALAGMFAAMDQAFKDTQFEFDNDREHLIQTFLTRFDAIFTLNQDLLLERHYLNNNVSLLSNGRWDGWSLPGLRLLERPANPLEPDTLGIWVPGEQREFAVQRRFQPLFKLHGSSNWRAGPDQNIMVLGGQKQELINKYPILSFNFAQFDEYLRRPDARLMIIGYGFADSHVNNAILAAVREAAVTLFIVDLIGIDVVDGNRDAQVYAPSQLAERLWPRVRGASRRPLASTFRDDRAEHAKLMGFFQ